MSWIHAHSEVVILAAITFFTWFGYMMGKTDADYALINAKLEANEQNALLIADLKTAYKVEDDLREYIFKHIASVDNASEVGVRGRGAPHLRDVAGN